ncbi:hypothetical protein QAD02_016706 [Eretmocerus hayati]|uniref:Uncharacterized protein n=1 Tax=Eretmocerus hayati TaxID=131215 RepID=A0ACC2PBD0_9HYME|nr:hypothetical protein QAD02_016706 [Eretmocerus hayati]
MLQKLFACRFCGKNFDTKNILTKHVRKVHPDENPYSCECCNKIFRDRYNLELHTRRHSGEKPFQCELCSKAYSDKYSWLRHVTTKHSNDKPFPCDTCGARFNRKSNLARHVKSHSDGNSNPSSCSICGEGLTARSELKAHMVCHSKDKSFACDLCGKSFKHRQNLDSHKKVLHVTDGTSRLGSCDGLAESTNVSTEQKENLIVEGNSGTEGSLQNQVGISEYSDHQEGITTMGYSELPSRASRVLFERSHPSTCDSEDKFSQEVERVIAEIISLRKETPKGEGNLDKMC